MGPMIPAPVPLPLARFRAAFIAAAPLRLPEYAGSAWRGAFGHALKRAVCVTRMPRCAGCTLRSACAYATIFESPPPPGATAMRKYNAAPHPFVLAPAEAAQDIAAGDSLGLGLTLVGRAAAQLPYVLHALGEAGRSGLTRSRAPLVLDAVEQEAVPGAGDWRAIFQPGQSPVPLPAVVPPCPPVPAVATLEIATPLRLKRDGRLVTPDAFRFADLAMNQLRRHSMLCLFHGPAGLDSDFAALKARARGVRTTDSRLAWQDWTRHSSRQDTDMQMGGLVGEVTVAIGDAPELWPHLWLGQFIHAGHGTSMGLGRYAIAAASLPED